MTFRPDTIRERLAMVRTTLAALRATAALPRQQFLADRKEEWATAYALQTAVQALLDAGATFSAGTSRRVRASTARSYPCSPRHGALGERLRGGGGFRNVLVHEYAAVDYGLMHEKLGHLEDLADFAAALDAWLVGIDR